MIINVLITIKRLGPTLIHDYTNDTCPDLVTNLNTGYVVSGLKSQEWPWFHVQSTESTLIWRSTGEALGYGVHCIHA